MNQQHNPICEMCGGYGSYLEPVCCNRPTIHGECCGNPDPERVQCPCTYVVSVDD